LKIYNVLLLGARFDFTLDDDLKVAAASDDVKNALAKKIKRERIGTEVHSSYSFFVFSSGITLMETYYEFMTSSHTIFFFFLFLRVCSLFCSYVYVFVYRLI
jgi:hypothetical protein